jgi:hypothetical protein
VTVAQYSTAVFVSRMLVLTVPVLYRPLTRGFEPSAELLDPRCLGTVAATALGVSLLSAATSYARKVSVRSLLLILAEF